ncbi:MAG: hypothetical protein V4673_16385 [Pseudomonadota bacterium]
MKNHRSFLLLALLALAPAAAQAHGDACLKPFQATGTVDFPAGYSGVTGQFRVPAGCRLRIEQISAGLRLPSATDTADFQVGTTIGGTFAWHDLEVAQGYRVLDRKAFGPVTLYADKGTDVRISIARITSTYTVTTAWWTVTGCLYVA